MELVLLGSSLTPERGGRSEFQHQNQNLRLLQFHLLPLLSDHILWGPHTSLTEHRKNSFIVLHHGVQYGETAYLFLVRMMMVVGNFVSKKWISTTLQCLWVSMTTTTPEGETTAEKDDPRLQSQLVPIAGERCWKTSCGEGKRRTKLCVMKDWS